MTEADHAFVGSPLRRSQSSPVPCKTYRGIIQVDNKDNGATLGYLSPFPSGPGYTHYQPNENDAFIVSFKIDPNQASGSAFGMTIEVGSRIDRVEAVPFAKSSGPRITTFSQLWKASPILVSSKAVTVPIPTSVLGPSSKSQIWIR